MTGVSAFDSIGLKSVANQKLGLFSVGRRPPFLTFVFRGPIGLAWIDWKMPGGFLLFEATTGVIVS